MEALDRRVKSRRLVTLVGPGGAGKTRLALETATHLLGDFPDGVWMVELASLRDPAGAGVRVAQAMGHHDPVGDVLQAGMGAIA